LNTGDKKLFKQTKQIIIIAVSFVVISFFFFSVFVPTIKNRIIEEEKNLLKNYVQIEVQHIEHHIQVVTKGVDEASTIEYLKSRRFGVDNKWYFFIIDSNGTTLLHPTRTSTIGIPIEQRNENFKSIFNKMQDALKHDGFIKYKRLINNDTKYEDAIAFVAYIPEYDWILGAALAVDDMSIIVWNLVFKLVPMIGILILFIIAILFYNVVQSSKIDKANRDTKTTQTKLDDSEEKYKTIFEGSLSAFSYHQMIYDDEGNAIDYKFIETNEEFKKMTGLRDVEGKTMKEIDPTFINEGWLDIYAKVANTGEKVRFDKFSSALDKWFSVSAYSVRKGYFASIFDDITENKKNEERIADLAKFPEENPNPVLRMTSDGFLVYANNPGKALVKEMGSSIGNYVSEECFQHLVECLSSKKVIIKEMKVKDSTFSMTFSPGVDFSYVNVYGLDITDRKRIEQALKQSEQNYAITFQSIGDAVIVLDNNFKISMINKTCQDVIGYDSAFCVGKFLPEIITLTENTDSKNRIEEMIAQVTKTKKIQNLLPLQMTRKDGKEILLEDSISPITMKNGDDIEKNLGYVIVFRDIYEKVQKEKRTEELEEQLHQTRKMEAIDQFSGGVAHDFNNIITAIQGFAEIMLLEAKEDDSFYESLNEIKNSCRRAANLTEKLLTLSKKQVIHTQIVDLNQIVSEYVEIAKRLAGEDIEIEANLKSNKTIKADTSQLDQILLNCTANARDAIRERAQSETNCERKIFFNTYDTSISDDVQSVRLGLSKGEYVVLEIKDTGKGIDNALKAKIFEPFFTTKAKGKGTGLGLSTVSGIVKQNKGSIFVYSEPSHGATFKIFWPVNKKEEIVSISEKQKEIISLKGTETILIVEDEIELNKLASKYLKSMGYTIYSASNGEEALQVVNSHKINLVITDVIMPKMGGYELIEELKKINSNIKSILTSGYTPDTFVENNSHFIGKPYSLNDLASKIRTILDSDHII
jgi:PAS domain S-box-containing protein